MQEWRRGISLGIATVLGAGMLAGCASAESSPAETVSSSAPPIETVAETAPALTDEEALQIAVETYEEFLAVSGNLLNTRGATMDQLEAITTANMADNNQQSLELAQSNEYTTEGVMPAVKSRLLDFEGGRIEAVVCIDYSRSQTFDSNGSPVGDDRTGLSEPFEIRVVEQDGEYRVDRSELWTESEFCSQ